MDEIDPITMYELCFPGAVTGEREVSCPHCEKLLTFEVSDPMGVYDLDCCSCAGEFTVDLTQGTVEWCPQG